MRDLSVPMTAHDFEQLILLANIMAIADRLMGREKPKTFRWNQYKGLHEKAEGIEATLVGHLEGIALDRSEKFYKDIDKAVNSYLGAVIECPTVGRDSRGRFCKLLAEKQPPWAPAVNGMSGLNEVTTDE